MAKRAQTRDATRVPARQDFVVVQLDSARSNLGDRTPLQAPRRGNLPGVLAAVYVLKSGGRA